eukprot:6137591-Amphidinium_carterae.1
MSLIDWRHAGAIDAQCCFKGTETLHPQNAMFGSSNPERHCPNGAGSRYCLDLTLTLERASLTPLVTTVSLTLWFKSLLLSGRNADHCVTRNLRLPDWAFLGYIAM